MILKERLFISQIVIDLGELSKVTYLVDRLRLICLLIILQLFPACLLP